MKIVKVNLGERSYDIRIQSGILAELGVQCRRLGLGQRCGLITDSHVAGYYAMAAEDSLCGAGFEPVRITVPPGETSKQLRYARQCYDELARHRLERSSFIVALGGGVVGDLAGFVAATYLRGIDLIQVPTSLLAQVDSSVGGKVGINLKAGKNLVGAFHQPRLVLCDLDSLNSLPARELRAGLAEVIKYGIIFDAAFFRRLEKVMPKLLARETTALKEIVARCCAIKAEIVGQDEKEGGLRAILNFGHTIGHAIEATAGYGEFLHGEAIAIGQVLAAQLSHSRLGLPAKSVDRIRNLLAACELPISLPPQTSPRKLLRAMQLDKKVRGGEIKFVLARRLGRVEFGLPVEAAQLRQFLNNFVG